MRAPARAVSPGRQRGRLVGGDDRVARADRAGDDHLGVDAAEVQALAGVGVDEAHGVEAEALGELGAAAVRDGGDLDDGLADAQPGAGRQLVGAEVEVDVELVAGERPRARASPATSAAARAFMTFNCISGCADRSAVRVLGRSRHVSPTSPTSRSSSPTSSTSRSPTAGRRTISSSRPVPTGEPAISSSPASSSSVVRCCHGRHCHRSAPLDYGSGYRSSDSGTIPPR